MRADRQIIETGRLSSHRVFAAALAVYLLSLALTLVVVVHRSGQVVFALDDPYIHLAIARNITNHFTFGVSPGVYESASSSPVWTVALALGLAATPLSGPLLVLGLGVAASTWTLWNLVPEDLPARFHHPTLALLALALLPITVGLVPLTMVGMEHTVQAAVVLQILLLLSRMIDGSASRWSRRAYYALVAVSALVRFESVFLAIGCALALVIAPPMERGGWFSWRRWRPAVGTGVAAMLPVAAFAIVNVVAGQYPLPNSVAAKSSVAGGAVLPTLATIGSRLARDRLLVVLLVLCVGALAVTAVQHRRGLEGALVALVTTFVLHAVFANIGWFDRYQAYLVIASVALLLRVAVSLPIPQTSVAEVAFVLVVVALTLPRLTLLSQVPGASQNIHEQQAQMAEFFARYYDHEAVAVNDLGYVAWRHDGPVIDLAGLGSYDVLRATKNGTADRAFFESLARRQDVRAVALYQDLFGGIVPDSWVRVETWCLKDELVSAAARCVTFYGPDRAAAERLSSALTEYDAQLPPTVDRTPMMGDVD